MSTHSERAGTRASSHHAKSLALSLVLGASLPLCSCGVVESNLGASHQRNVRFGTESWSAPHQPQKASSAEGNEIDGFAAFASPDSGSWARWNALRGDAYELDAIDRFVEPATHPLGCDPSAMVIYRGQSLRYQGGAVTVSAPFRERLARFEQVVIEVATEVYGRAPSKIVHFGAYSCRASRNRSYRLSEHALGNAIDLVGFDFGALGKGKSLDAALPRQLRGPFQVRVAKHWYETGKASHDVHARFLRALTQRLRERSDVFRGMIGPSRRDHGDHLHLDVSPWRYDWL